MRRHINSKRTSLCRPAITFEPLEFRRLLASIYYVNDDWENLTDPGQPVEFLDEVSDGVSISGFYGINAFGTVEGTSLPEYDQIFDAIQASLAGDTVHILAGTYAESDIVIDRPLTITGDGRDATFIVPEVTSADENTAFHAGTHAGIIIYSPDVTIQDLEIDGNGNGTLGGSLHFHQGITTLYDKQGSGNYASLHNGSLAPSNLGGDHPMVSLVVRGEKGTSLWTSLEYPPAAQCA
jgi:hypothetical protein